MAFLCLLGFIFTFSETMILTLGGWLKQSTAGIQFHRIEQLAGTFFLFGTPYLIIQLLELNAVLKKITRIIVMAGLAFSLVSTVLAFVMPDLFISVSHHHPQWLIAESYYGRGREGPVIMIRDILLALTTLYCLGALIYDLIIHKKSRYTLPIILGLTIGIYAAFCDIMYVYTHIQFDFFQGINFSRFTAGITFFITSAVFSVLTVFIDKVSELNVAYKALNESYDRFSQISDNINEAFWLIDYRNNHLLFINPAFEKIWGIPRKELYLSPLIWMKKICKSDKARVSSFYEKESIATGGEIEYKIRISGSKIKWIREAVFPVYQEGELKYLVRLTDDITAKKKAEKNLAYLAYYDSLTTLPNRKSFYKELSETIIKARRHTSEKTRALLFIDIDNFKLVNDTLGHLAGDELLIKVGERIKKILRQSDCIFRLGSDEFTIILSSLYRNSDAGLVAQKLKEDLGQPFVIYGQEINISVSMGICTYPKDGENADILMQHADIALFEAKKKKDNYQFFTHSMQAEAEKRVSLASQLRAAIEKENEFVLYYQPQVDPDGKIIGTEALIRWYHNGKIISPIEFIPIAEETGLIIPLGEWVLRTACMQRQKWQEAGIKEIKISINLSPRQFRQKDLNEIILRIIRDSGVDYQSFDFEITESSIMEDPDVTISKIREFKERGISISIDDFGTEYSSLSYLQKLPVTNLKIDKSFVVEMESNNNNAKLVNAIIHLAHNLQIKTVAEGVENEQQVLLLQMAGCDTMQGFFFGKPQPPDIFTRMLLSNRKLNKKGRASMEI